MNNIEEIKARVDIVDLISETVQLRKSGKSFSGFCPFHDNKRTPAFAVFPESGTWRCFGQCNEGGDIFKYVMKKEGWDFAEALNYLAQKAGIELKPISPQDKEREEEYTRLRTLLEDTVMFFRHQLIKTPAGAQALAYLGKRGLDSTSIETWELGYAPPGWNTTRDHLISKGYTEEELLQVGVVSPKDAGGSFDRYRNRLMFPIRDERGKMAGFGARILNPDDVPKFLNSPQTPLFDKGKLLYGLDKARRAIRMKEQAVIVEGYLDVIAAHQYGFTNVVSPMGTALTEHQIRLVKRQTHRIILALDSDAAGDKATMRGLEVARQTMDREGDISFDPRGLVRIEGRLQADIRICTLPEGLDPDDVLHENPDTFSRLLEEAKPVVIHVMDTLAKDENLDDPKAKSRIADQVLPLIEDVPDPIERETYRQRLARLIRVDERSLASRRPVQEKRPGQPSRTRRGQPQQPHALPQQTAQETIRLQEEHLLGVLLRNPQHIYKLDRALQNVGLLRISTEDFQNTDHQLIISIIQKALDQDFSQPHHVAIGSMPLSLMPLADELLRKSKEIETSDDRLLEDLFLTIIRLRNMQLYKSVEHLKFMMEESQQEGKPFDPEYQTAMVMYITARNRLDQASQQGKMRNIFH